MDWAYNVLLRQALDAAGFTATRIVASDQGNGWALPPNNNSTELAVLDAIGAHWRIDRKTGPGMPSEEADRLYEGWRRAVARVRSEPA